MKLDYKKLGKQIRAQRIKHNITQEALAEKCNLSVSHISHIETGNTKVSLQSLFAISKALDVSLDFLVGNEYNNYKNSEDTQFIKDFKNLLSDCTIKEKKAIFSTSAALKEALKDKTVK